MKLSGLSGLVILTLISPSWLYAATVDLSQLRLFFTPEERAQVHTDAIKHNTQELKPKVPDSNAVVDARKTSTGNRNSKSTTPQYHKKKPSKASTLTSTNKAVQLRYNGFIQKENELVLFFNGEAFDIKQLNKQLATFKVTIASMQQKSGSIELTTNKGVKRSLMDGDVLTASSW